MSSQNGGAVDISETVNASRNEVRRGALSVIIVLGLLGAIYYLANEVFPGRLSTFASAYVAQPLLWLGLVLVVVAAYKYGGWGELVIRRSHVAMGLLLGVFHVAVLVIAGLFAVSGFANSPYAHSLRYLFLNTVFFGMAVVGLEFGRAYLLRAMSRRYTTLALILTALLFAFLMMPLRKFTGVEEPFPFLAGTCLPLLAQNLLASLLALLGGPLASVAYWLVIEAFEWYSPMLPNLSWIFQAFAVTLSAVIGLLIVQSLHGAELEPATEVEAGATKKKSSLVGWVLVAVVCVVIIFLSFGALGFRPTIVGSGSMTPALEVYDVVIVRAVDAGNISEGDIIQFRHGSSRVIHRVVEVRENGGLSFITKGDASDSVDSTPVYPGEIEGKVQFRIPKIGWVSVGLKSLLT